MPRRIAWAAKPGQPGAAQMTSIRAYVSPLFAGLLAMQASPAAAVDRGEVSHKVLYQAVDQLTDYLNKDMAEIAKHTKKTAIVNYTQSEDLPTSIQHYLIKRLEHLAAKNENTTVKFVQCVECTALHSVAEGDEIFIRQGITTDDQLKETLKKLDIRKYGDVHLAYTGDQLVMQMNVVDENKMVDWSGEYKTPYKAYNESQWMFGVNAEAGAFQGGNNMPSAQGARVSFGQRLTGIGAAGLSASAFQPAPGVPQIASLGAFFSLSHNEVFNQYWKFVNLYYNTELGVTDFNGNQLIHETVGVKTILGRYYSVALNTKFHQFIAAPDDDTPIANDEGEPVLKNNEPLPMMVSLALGVEFF
jgi:hypothetical protein